MVRASSDDELSIYQRKLAGKCSQQDVGAFKNIEVALDAQLCSES